jgi:hypothetical protein
VSEEISDDELYAELMDETSYLPYGAIVPEIKISDKTISSKRLQFCLDCKFNKNLICQKNGTPILTQIKVEHLECPIGKW